MKKISYLTLTGLTFAVAASQAAMTESSSSCAVIAQTEQSHVALDLATSSSTLQGLPPVNDELFAVTKEYFKANAGQCYSADDESNADITSEISMLMSDIRELIEDHDADIDYINETSGATLLHLAVRNNNYLLVKSLLQQGANPHTIGQHGLSPVEETHKKLHKIQLEKAALLASTRSEQFASNLRRVNTYEKMYNDMMRVFQPYMANTCKKTPYLTQMHELTATGNYD